MASKKVLLARVVEALSVPGFPSALTDRAKTLRLILDELENKQLRIGVIGITSAGKSAFLNTLLGEELLPEQSIPTSNVLTYLRKGNRLLTVSFENGMKKTFSGKELTRKILLHFTSEEQNPQNKHKLKRVDLTHPDIPFSPELELVDTPGLNAFRHPLHQQVTLDEFVPHADIIIYMTSIRNPFKESDYKALEHVVEHDQRVLFVMSGKDLEKDDKEGGQIIRSKESKLDQHMERLKKDTAKREGLRTSGHVLIDSKSGLYSKREPELWQKSGFASVVSTMNLFEKDLTAIMSESRYRRVRSHVDHAIETAAMHLDFLRGDAKKAQKNVDRLDKLINGFKDSVKFCEKEIGSVYLALDENNLNRDLRESSLTKNSTQSEFDKLRTDCDSKLDSAYNHLRGIAESIRINMAKTLEKQGLEAPRKPIPEASLTNLPSAVVQYKSERVTYTTSRGWFESLKFWPGEDEHTETVHVPTLEQFLADLKSRNGAGLRRLQHHVEKLKETFISRYMPPLRGELRKFENELAMFGKEETYGSSESQMLALLDLLRQASKEMGQCGLDDVKRNRFDPVKDLSPSKGNSKKNGKVGALSYYLTSFNELSFSRRLFTMLGMDSKPLTPLRVAIVGLDYIDRKNIVDLLSHRLGEMLNDLEFGIFYSLSSKKNTLPLFARQWPVTEAALWDWVSLVVAPDDESKVAWEEHGADLENWADYFLVLVDGPRIGSGLSSLHMAPYCRHLTRNQEKIVYVIPHGAKFDDKLSDLFTQVVPQLKEKGPYGQRPILVHENYDTRYTDFIELAAEVESSTELRRRWNNLKYSMEPPFTETILEDVYFV